MNKIDLKKETVDTLKFVGVLILIFVLINVIFTYVPPFSNYNLFAIQTDSMTGVIEPGDVVVTKKINPEEIQVGDIMAFRVDITNDGVDDVVVHFVDEINPHGDQLIYKTSPAVSDEQDRWTIEETDIIGIYVYQVESIGKILLFLQSWVGRIILLVDIIIISVLYDLLFSKKEKDKKEEDKTDNQDEKIIMDTIDESTVESNLQVEQKDYTKLTVQQLKLLAKEKGLKGYSKLKKAELIQLITTKK